MIQNETRVPDGSDFESLDGASMPNLHVLTCFFVAEVCLRRRASAHRWHVWKFQRFSTREQLWLVIQCRMCSTVWICMDLNLYGCWLPSPAFRWSDISWHCRLRTIRHLLKNSKAEFQAFGTHNVMRYDIYSYIFVSKTLSWTQPFGHCTFER